MTTFALVHGAWHGAWCWERLVPELEARGHRAVAVDLPCDDPAATLSTYAGVVVDALATVGADADVVVVGHSLGGCTIPLVAAARPVRQLVYLTPSVPRLGSSLVEAMGEEPINTVEVLAELELVDEAFLRLQEEMWPSLYNRCTEEDMAWAGERLRLQALTPLAETFPLDAFPDVPVTVLLGEDDRLIDVPMMTEIVRRRLGVEPVVIPSDHSPFLCIPAQLAEILGGIARG
jgi:pimeloyl-ACP methyl ester carboxylesterase